MRSCRPAVNAITALYPWLPCPTLYRNGYLSSLRFSAIGPVVVPGSQNFALSRYLYTPATPDLTEPFNACWAVNNAAFDQLLGFMQTGGETPIFSLAIERTVTAIIVIISLLCVFGMVLELPNSKARVRKVIATRLRFADLRVCEHLSFVPLIAIAHLIWN
jgi:hypothetical protein